MRKPKPTGRHRWKRRPYSQETLDMFKAHNWAVPESRYWDCLRCGQFVYDMSVPARTKPTGFVGAVGKCPGKMVVERRDWE